MIMRFIVSMLVAGILFSCGKEASLSFRNPQDVDRSDEVIVLTKEELYQKTGLQEGTLPLFALSDNSPVPFQLDDMDQDGNWDEVALLLSFAPGETKKITVIASDGKNYPPEFEKRTNLRLGIE